MIGASEPAAAKSLQLRPGPDLGSRHLLRPLNRRGCAILPGCGDGFLRRNRSRRLRRAPDAPSLREPQRVVRRDAGSDARGRRPDPRLRPVAGAFALRGPARRDRRRNQRDRHHLPACADARRAGPKPVPGTCSSPIPASAVRVSEYVPRKQKEEGGRGGQGGAASAPPLVAGGRGPRRRSRGERPAALRRDAERDDRRPDHPGCRAQQPGPRRGLVPGDTRRRDCAGGTRRHTWPSSVAGFTGLLLATTWSRSCSSSRPTSIDRPAA